MFVVVDDEHPAGMPAGARGTEQHPAGRALIAKFSEWAVAASAH